MVAARTCQDEQRVATAGPGASCRTPQLHCRTPVCSQTCHRPPQQVCGAITRQKKEQIVTELTSRLEKSVIVFGLRFKGLDVRGQLHLLGEA